MVTHLTTNPPVTSLSTAEKRDGGPSNISRRFIVEYRIADAHPQWFFCTQSINRAHFQAGMILSLNSAGQHIQFINNALAAVNATSTKQYIRGSDQAYGIRNVTYEQMHDDQSIDKGKWLINRSKTIERSECSMA